MTPKYETSCKVCKNPTTYLWSQLCEWCTDLANPDEAVPQPILDDVNKPAHYTYSPIETIDVIEAWGLGYHLGNVVKYLSRAKHKGTELKCLKKARFYLDRYIKLLEKEDK